MQKLLNVCDLMLDPILQIFVIQGRVLHSNSDLLKIIFGLLCKMWLIIILIFWYIFPISVIFLWFECDVKIRKVQVWIERHNIMLQDVENSVDFWNILNFKLRKWITKIKVAKQILFKLWNAILSNCETDAFSHQREKASVSQLKKQISSQFTK